MKHYRNGLFKRTLNTNNSLVKQARKASKSYGKVLKRVKKARSL